MKFVTTLSLWKCRPSAVQYNMGHRLILCSVERQSRDLFWYHAFLARNKEGVIFHLILSLVKLLKSSFSYLVTDWKLGLWYRGVLFVEGVLWVEREISDIWGVLCRWGGAVTCLEYFRALAWFTPGVWCCSVLCVWFSVVLQLWQHPAARL